MCGERSFYTHLTLGSENYFFPILPIFARRGWTSLVSNVYTPCGQQFGFDGRIIGSGGPFAMTIHNSGASAIQILELVELWKELDCTETSIDIDKCGGFGTLVLWKRP